MPEALDETTARNRWLAIQAVRLGSVALLVAGLLMASRGDSETVRNAGYLVVLAGAVANLVLPRMLARKWKSPPE